MSLNITKQTAQNWVYYTRRKEAEGKTWSQSEWPLVRYYQCLTRKDNT